jgi:hypothetical protein
MYICIANQIIHTQNIFFLQNSKLSLEKLMQIL